ncbi:MAG: hypothetical protein WD929_02650 [Steroidobacteraceae bacterium]
MPIRKSRNLTLVLGLMLVGAFASADDIRPESKARPLQSEQCIEQCDMQSDECMQDAAGDPGKSQVCDDKYSECLQACEKAGS